MPITASAQVGVAVYVTNNTAAKVKGVFQSTDAGDGGTNCLATSGTGVLELCNQSKNYNNPPKNIKNLLCISTSGKLGLQYTQQCRTLMFSEWLQEEQYLDLAVRGRLRYECRSHLHLSDRG